MKIKHYETLGYNLKKITPDLVVQLLIKNKAIFKINKVIYFEDENGNLINGSTGKRTELYQYLTRMKIRTFDHPKTGENIPYNMIRQIEDKVIAYAEETKEEQGDIIKFSNGYYSISQKKIIDEPYGPVIERLNYNYNFQPKRENIDFCVDYLIEITKGDNIKIHNLQNVMALTILRQNKNNAIINIYGSGGTGKSTFGYLLQQLAGDDNTSHLQPYQFSKDFDKATLLNKTVNISIDTTKRDITDTATSFLKALSGEDTISTDIKHQDMISFQSKAQQVFIGNYPLNFGENMDGAIHDRLVNIELNKRFRKTINDHRGMKQLLTRKEILETFAYLALQKVDKDGYVEFKIDKEPVQQTLPTNNAFV